MPNFNGQLHSNEIFAGMYNMLISQYVEADNIKGTGSKLVDEARVDGTLYGDTKLYYASDVLASKQWNNDREAQNLLTLHRPEDPKVQALTLDIFRYIPLTIDNYLSKRAWISQGAFGQFTSVMLSWMRETKKIYDSTTYNSYIGTAKTKANRAEVQINVTAAVGAATGEEKNRLEGAYIAEGLANLFVDLTDISRDFNDYKFLRSYDMSDLKVVWSSTFVNKIRKVDVPTIFNNMGLVDKFAEDVLPARYFGNVNTMAGDTDGDNKTVRSLIEKEYGGVHVFAGDLLPNSTHYEANETYTVDNTIICKVIHKRAVPFMSAFETATDFFNPLSLTENHYLIWGHNTLEYLYNLPLISVKEV